jgi:hypothetical protein
MSDVLSECEPLLAKHVLLVQSKCHIDTLVAVVIGNLRDCPCALVKTSRLAKNIRHNHTKKL